MYVLCRYDVDVAVAFNADGRGRLGADAPTGLLSSVALRDGGACSITLLDAAWGATDGVDGRVVDLLMPQVPDGARIRTIIKTTTCSVGRMPIEHVQLHVARCAPRLGVGFEYYSEPRLFFDMRYATICAALVPTHDFRRYMNLNRVDYIDIIAPQLAGTTAYVRFGCVDVEHVGTGQRLVHALYTAPDTYTLAERVMESIVRTGSYDPASGIARECPTEPPSRH